jgi:hypothetical protein
VSNRQIIRSSSTSNAEIRELLQGIFAAELLCPSRQLWVVSPWLSDIELLDNRSGAFASLDPQWGSRQIRLVEMLGRLLELGTQVIIATRPDSHNESFLRKLEDISSAAGNRSRLSVHRLPTLHTKGILGDDFYISGSMNITFNGVEVLEEGLLFTTEAESVANARIAFLDGYKVDGVSEGNA